MSVGSADLVKGLVAIWISSGLETVFKDAWSTADKAEFVALSDTQAEGSHPHPYCVFEVADGETVARMTSAGSSYNWEIRDVPVTFTIYTKDQGGTESAKSAAARLAEEVMKVFGGHPSVRNQMDRYSLDNGNVITATLLGDNGARVDYKNWSWHLRYKFSSDVPAAVV